MNPTTKEAARAAWHQQIQNRIGAATESVSEPMQQWRALQMALARYDPGFHGGLHVAYSTGPQAFAAVVAALENGFKAAAGAHQRRPLFRGV